MSNLEDLLSRQKFQDEESDDDVKDNWDDEEPEKPPPPPQKEPKKIVKKPTGASADVASSSNKPLTAQQLRDKKLLEEKMQRDSDFKLTKEMFGKEDKDIDLNFQLNSQEDFELFHKNLVAKLWCYDKSPHYYTLLDKLFRDLCVPLEAEELKNLSATINALFNEKVKVNKAKPKKKAAKGYAIKVERSHFDRDDLADELEDFM